VLVSQGPPFLARNHQQRRSLERAGVQRQRSLGTVANAYRSASEEYLRRLPAPHTLEKVVDNVLGHLDVHGLDGRRSGGPGPYVGVRSPTQGNAASGKQSGGHGEGLASCRR
jgi:hypothetical protein